MTERQPSRRRSLDPPESETESESEASSSSGDEGLVERIERWQQIARMVRTRPQYQARTLEVVREAGPEGPQIVRVTYRGGRVVEGTIDGIFNDLSTRISAVVDSLVEEQEDYAWPRQHRLQQQQLQQQQQQQQQRRLPGARPNGRI
jgi:hypothetical protein